MSKIQVNIKLSDITMTKKTQEFYSRVPNTTDKSVEGKKNEKVVLNKNVGGIFFS